MSLMIITETLARTLIAKGTAPQPRRVLTPEGMIALDEWVRRVAEEGRRQDLRQWVLRASEAACSAEAGDDVQMVIPAGMSKSGRREALTMSRHLFFWQVDAG